MDKTYVDKKFGEKKEAIEHRNAITMETRGGWFGLTHTSVLKHYNRFKYKLRSKSPFLIAEKDPATIRIIREEVSKINDPRIDVLNGDLFDEMFNTYPSKSFNTIKGKAKHRVPLFSYGHLDFCCTAVKLIDQDIHRNIRKLAGWWALKDTFHLDISVSHRGDKNLANAHALLDTYIPVTFQQLNWKMCYSKKVDYKDSSMMRNVFYKFERLAPQGRNNGRVYYIDENL